MQFTAHSTLVDGRFVDECEAKARRILKKQGPRSKRSRACCGGRQRVLAWRAVGPEELDRIIARAGAGDARSPAAFSSQWGCGGPDRG
jgi:hypothetical protein